MSDGHAASAPATVTIDIASVNDAPVAKDDNATVESGQPLAIDPTANDSDADGDALAVLSVGQPANGTISLSGNTVTYNANSGFVGRDSFTYVITDGKRSTATATVNVDVTEPMQKVTFSWDYTGDPAAIGGFRMYVNGTAVCETSDTSLRELACLIPLRDEKKVFTVAAIAAGGEQLSNQIVYDPHPAPVNTPPTTADDSATTEGTAPVTINVIANDTDADGDVLSLAAVSQPLNGSVSLQGDSIVYTANQGFVGTDSFTYTVSDGIDTAVAAVTVTVKQPMEKISFQWDFDPAVSVSSFRLYVNRVKACEVFDPAARQASCLVPADNGPRTFGMTFVDPSGVESAISNQLTY